MRSSKSVDTQSSGNCLDNSSNALAKSADAGAMGRVEIVWETCFSGVCTTAYRASQMMDSVRRGTSSRDMLGGGAD